MHSSTLSSVHELVNEGESESNAFFFSTGIITDTRTYIIHQNEASPR